jgi:hypothetical protein
MATVAVVDAQQKSKSSTEEIVRRSRWWKRSRKVNREI